MLKETGMIALLMSLLTQFSLAGVTDQAPRAGLWCVTMSCTSPLGTTTTYTYDALNRLKSETGPAATRSFTYDPNGNRTSDGAAKLTILPGKTHSTTVEVRQE